MQTEPGARPWCAVGARSVERLQRSAARPDGPRLSEGAV